jgi:trehalose-6-phosphate synthase
MSDNIIKFPGFILLDDRNTILHGGKRYKNTKAMVVDLSRRDLRRTYQWHCKRALWPVDYRARVMRDALEGPQGVCHGGNAA